MSNKLREVLSWIPGFFLFSLVFLWLSTCVILSGVVPSGSMEPTINVGDRIIGIRFLEPKVGDIVIFHPNPEEDSNPDSLWVKRLIGLPGDRIKIVNGDVYVNGKKIDEPYVVNRDIKTNLSLVVPDGRYFVLGDNRINSADSRYWENPFLREEQFVAVCKLRVFPFIDFKYFGGMEQDEIYSN